jgi:hypothetical protein
MRNPEGDGELTEILDEQARIERIGRRYVELCLELRSRGYSVSQIETMLNEYCRRFRAEGIDAPTAT